MARKSYEESNIQAIANTIREKTGTKETYKTSEMANGVAEVYEAGKKAEQRAFWEQFHKRTNWQYAFAYAGAWTDENYNPIYTIKISSANTNMYYDTNITDTKVPLDASGRTLNYTFRDSDIVTIPELIVNESTDLNQAFTSCSKLKNIKITGTLAKSVTMNSCPLTVESMKNIILALKDYSGTDNKYTYTTTFKSSAFSALEVEGATAEYNGVTCTWAELIDNKKWNLTLA